MTEKLWIKEDGVVSGYLDLSLSVPRSLFHILLVNLDAVRVPGNLVDMNLRITRL